MCDACEREGEGREKMCVEKRDIRVWERKSPFKRDKEYIKDKVC